MRRDLCADRLFEISVEPLFRVQLGTVAGQVEQVDLALVGDAGNHQQLLVRAAKRMGYRGLPRGLHELATSVSMPAESPGRRSSAVSAFSPSRR